MKIGGWIELIHWNLFWEYSLFFSYSACSFITDILGGPASCHSILSPNFSTPNCQLQKRGKWGTLILFPLPIRNVIILFQGNAGMWKYIEFSLCDPQSEHIVTEACLLADFPNFFLFLWLKLETGWRYMSSWMGGVQGEGSGVRGQGECWGRAEARWWPKTQVIKGEVRWRLNHSYKVRAQGREFSTNCIIQAWIKPWRDGAAWELFWVSTLQAVLLWMGLPRGTGSFAEQFWRYWFLESHINSDNNKNNDSNRK